MLFAISINVCWIESKLDADANIVKYGSKENLKLIREALKDAKKDGEKEIFADGKLYDVAITEKSRDSVYYYVFEDKEEEDALDEAFSSIATEPVAQTGKDLQLCRHKVIIKGLDLLYNFKWIEYKLCHKASILYFDEQDKECICLHFKILTPPPQQGRTYPI